MTSLSRAFAMLCLCLLLPISGLAEPARNLAVAPADAGRVALVIGNSAYTNGPLANPVNDARAIAAKLRKQGFKVHLRENLKTREIGSVYREFRNLVTPGGVALVFYAGHGIQFKGQNYFPAVDADISSEEDVPLQSLNLGTLLDNMEESKAGVSLVLLDACRDNPFARRFRSASRGLAKVETASGTLIHYATKPGSVASDGNGTNGTYTEALLAQMDAPGVPIELMLKKVTNLVVGNTRGKQEPWMEGSLRGDFFFVPVAGTQVASLVPNITSARTPEQIEDELWDTIKDGDNPIVLEEYIKGYPKGRYVVQARVRMAKLKDATRPAPAIKEDAVMKPVKVFKDCADCPEMVIIPAGSFDMGGSDSGEQPIHRVAIGSFALGKTEVTQGQWKAIMGSNPSHFSSCGDTCPVEKVNLIGVQEFIRKLSQKTGKQYRLPTESEWEYSCRAGGREEYCGSESPDNVAWYGANSGNVTHPVGSKQPNAWGLYDMSGNVWEFVEDCWNANYSGAPSDGSVWTSEKCSAGRIIRGGSWGMKQQRVRAAFRVMSGSIGGDLGFRLARTIP